MTTKAPAPRGTPVAKGPTPGVTAPPTAPPAPTPGGVPNSAADLLKQTLTAWGLDSLLPHLQDYLNQGYDSSTINLALQSTNEWKTRFAGNVERQAKGLSVLTPAQYLAAEEQYRNVLQSYGLPAGFYDSHSDFNDFIGNDVSPTEISARAKIAHDQYLNAPQQARDTWAQYYGTQGDAIAAILDPNTATQLIQDRADTVGIGTAAAMQGLSVTQQRASQLQQQGTTLAAAQKAYSQIAQSMPVDQNIASRFGQQFGQTQEENDLLLGNAAASTQRQSLYNSEKALFESHNGADTASLGVSQDH